MKIVRVSVRGGADDELVPSGTAFLVGPRHALTAAHVVSGYEEVELEWVSTVGTVTTSRSATVVLSEDDKLSADWALLEVTEGAFDEWLFVGDPSERVGDSAQFRSSGFVHAWSAGALELGGSVRWPAGGQSERGILQVAIDELSAGRGQSIKGASGAPILLDGVVVGVLTTEARLGTDVVYGRGFATTMPVIWERLGQWMNQHLRSADAKRSEQARRIHEMLLAIDPEFGLPGIPWGQLPPTPFKALEPYASSDAALYVGRPADLHALHKHVTSDDPSRTRIVLLYGPSGAGKSSFLRAGLFPRMGLTHQVLLAPRTSTSLESLAGAIGAEDIRAATISARWRQLETEGKKPLVVVIDQVEDYLVADGADQTDFQRLLTSVRPMFDVAPTDNVRGSLILSFRNEWLQDVDHEFRAANLACKPFPFRHVEIAQLRTLLVRLEKQQRLADHYRIKFDENIINEIATKIAHDTQAAVGPTLQILLAQMWKSAKDHEGRKLFNHDLLKEALESGVAVRDYVERQLLGASARLKGDAALVDLGLALQVLASHTTELRSAASVSREDLEREYGRSPTRKRQLQTLLGELDKARLLVSETAGDGQLSSTRLVHDLVAPVVKQMVDTSITTGARARRVLDYHRTANTPTIPLPDLRTIARGIGFTRELDDNERRRLTRSWIGVGTKFAAIGVLLVTLGFVGYKFVQLQISQRDSEVEAQRERAAAAYGAVFREPSPIDRALSAGLAVDKAPAGDILRPTYELGAIHIARTQPELIARFSEPIVAIDYDGRLVATSAPQAKGVSLWEVRGTESRLLGTLSEVNCEITKTRVQRPLLVVVARCGETFRIIAWRIDVRTVRLLTRHDIGKAINAFVFILSDHEHVRVVVPQRGGSHSFVFKSSNANSVVLERFQTSMALFDVVAVGGELRQAEVVDGTRVEVTIPGHGVRSIAAARDHTFIATKLSDDGRWLAVIAKTPTSELQVLRWDTQTLDGGLIAAEKEPELGGPRPRIVSISTDGEMIVWTSGRASHVTSSSETFNETFKSECPNDPDAPDGSTSGSFAAGYLVCSSLDVATRIRVVRLSKRCQSDPDLPGCTFNLALPPGAQPSFIQLRLVGPDSLELQYSNKDDLYLLRFRRAEPDPEAGNERFAHALPDGFLFDYRNDAGGDPVGKLRRISDRSQNVWKAPIKGFPRAVAISGDGGRMLLDISGTECGDRTSMWNAHNAELIGCLRDAHGPLAFHKHFAVLVDEDVLYVVDADLVTPQLGSNPPFLELKINERVRAISASGELLLTENEHGLAVQALRVEGLSSPTLSPIGPRFSFATDSDLRLFETVIREAQQVTHEDNLMSLSMPGAGIDVVTSRPARMRIGSIFLKLPNAANLAPTKLTPNGLVAILQHESPDVDGNTQLGVCAWDVVIGVKLGCTHDGLGAPLALAFRIDKAGDLMHYITPLGEIHDWVIGASGRLRPWAGSIAKARLGAHLTTDGQVESIDMHALTLLRSQLVNELCAARDQDVMAAQVLDDLEFSDVRLSRGGKLCN